MSSILKIFCYEFKAQLKSKRIWLGYMVGIVLIIHHSFAYIQYADEIGEPVNVLEPFLIAANNPNSIVFLAVGWLLAISGVPFVDNISYYIIYRTGRKKWNFAIVLYMCFQAVIYYIVLLVSTMIAGVQNGYWGNVWSYPITKVTVNAGGKYNINFPYTEMLETKSVYMAVIYTLVLAIGYAILLGLLIYVVSLLCRRNMGPLVGVLFHFLGYEIMKEGLGYNIDFSLLARSMPALQIGNTALTDIGGTVILYLLGIIILIGLSKKIIRFIDFKESSVMEEEW